MKVNSVLPYYHPTTIACIDDDANLLRDLQNSAAREHPSRLFTNPKIALDFINSRAYRSTLTQRCMSFGRNQKNKSSNTIIRVNFEAIENEIRRLDRFSAISVLIVDYDMPEMNGLEFCKAVKDRNIKKILLTGVGNERLAINAFNDGLIDRFIHKGDAHANTFIEDSIQECQRRYFYDLCMIFQNMLSIQLPLYFSDDVFKSYFFEVIQTYNFCEYFYVEQPGGFIFMKPDGEISRLVVMTEEDAAEMLSIAREHGAPDEIIEKIKNEEVILHFWANYEDYINDDDFDWSDYLSPALTIKGKEKYSCSLILNPPIDIDFEQSISNFENYLDQIDELSFNEIDAF